jgi:ABC-2 type transport system permease protein
VSGARWIVARREVIERARSRAFQIAVAIQALSLVVVIVVAVLTGGGETRTVGLVGADAQPYAAALRAAAPTLDATVRTVPLPDRAAARRAVRDGDVDLAVIDGRELIVEDDPDSALVAAAQAAHRQLALRDALEDAGVPPAAREAALDPPPLRVAVLDRQAAERAERGGVAFVGVLLLYIAIFTYGMWVAGGIVEEKASRVIEIVLSAIPPRELLAGKIIGLGALGLAQFASLIAVGLAVASAIDAVELPDVAVGWAALVAGWFLLGYALYACLYAVAGALVSRQEDLQTSTGALNMTVIAAYVLSFIALSDPNGVLMTVLSFVPVSAPMAMPARWLVTEVPAWQVVLAALLTLAATGATLRLAALVYARAALRLGPKLSLRAALAGRGA